MANEVDQDKQPIPISELKPLQTEWLIKVLVLRRGPIRDYKNSNGEGAIRLLIFVDEEGTKIQGTLFNEHIQTWENYFEPLKAYYIEDGKIMTPKTNYLTVNGEVEISFRKHTKVTECSSEFMTANFANGFISFIEAARLPLGTLFDVVGILLQVKPLIGEGRRTRREVIITDDRYDRKTLTLWGDLAEIEGTKLASFQHDKSVVAFCDIKGSIYQGEFTLSSTPVSSVLFEPKFEKAEDLQKWHTAIKACDVDISFMPSRIMQQAKKIALGDIIKGECANKKDQYYRFNATLLDIINIDDVWYTGCIKCHKKVTVKKSSASCDYCKKEDIDYENRYRIKITVSAKEGETIVLTLFRSARYLLGCDIEEYIQSTSNKEQESPYTRKMEQSKGKLFSFLIKNPLNFSAEEKNKNLIVEEMHEAEKLGPEDLEVEPLAAKKITNQATTSDDTNKEDYPAPGKKPKVEIC